MNAILSLFLSFAMLFTGGALPAAMDSVSTVTVQDAVVGYAGENYPLGFNFSLSAGAAQDELVLHFEAENGDGEVLMPVSGRITPDGVTFSLNDEGNAYTISAETLNALLGMEEGDVSSVETVVGGIEGYINAVSALQNKQAAALTAGEQAAVLDVVYANMDNMVREEMEWDFGNGDIPVESVTGTLSGADLFTILDGWLALENEDLTTALTGILDLYNAVFSMNYAYSVLDEVTVYEDKDAATIGVIGGADGPTAIYVAGEKNEKAEFVPAESFTQLFEMMAGEDEDVKAQLDQISVEMTIITGTEGDTGHQIVDLFMIMDESMESTMNVTVEANAAPDASDAYFSLYMEQGSVSASYEVQTQVEGPADNPSSINMEMMMQTDSTIDITDYEAEEVEEDVIYASNTVYLNAGSIYEDGLEDSDVYMETSASSVRYTGGEFTGEDEGETVTFTFFTDEEKDEEDRLVTFYDISVSANEEENYTLSFNTVRSEAPAEDYFAGLNAVEMPADGEDPAYQALSGDFLVWMGEAMTIASSEEFAALAEAFSGEETTTANYEEETYAEEYTGDFDAEDEYAYEDGDDEEYYEGDYEFTTLEEAAEVFAGDLIGYTAPEGFELESVYATGDGTYLNANYASEDGRYISFNQEYYGDDAGEIPDYFSVGDGAAGFIGGNIASVYKTESGYYYAQFYLSNGSLSIYFDDCDAAAVEAILAGLEI